MFQTIKAIFTTGKKAYNLYQKYFFKETKIQAIPLPSTSPANCPKGIEETLNNTYSKIKDYTNYFFIFFNISKENVEIIAIKQAISK